MRVASWVRWCGLVGGLGASAAAWACPEGRLEVTAWAGTALSGAPYTGPICLVARSVDLAIDRRWGVGGPSRCVEGCQGSDPRPPRYESLADGFSMRWEGRFGFDPGLWEVEAVADDGLRVWVDGVPVVDAWWVGPERSHVARLALPGGVHTVRVEYFEASGEASVRVGWRRVGDAPVEAGPRVVDAVLEAGPPALASVGAPKPPAPVVEPGPPKPPLPVVAAPAPACAVALRQLRPHMGQLSPSSPSCTFTYRGLEGDRVTVRARADGPIRMSLLGEGWRVDGTPDGEGAVVEGLRLPAGGEIRAVVVLPGEVAVRYEVVVLPAL